MNLGSGLTLQTRIIGDKTTSGIYFNLPLKDNATTNPKKRNVISKVQKFPLRNQKRAEDAEISQESKPNVNNNVAVKGSRSQQNNAANQKDNKAANPQVGGDSKGKGDRKSPNSMSTEPDKSSSNSKEKVSKTENSALKPKSHSNMNNSNNRDKQLHRKDGKSTILKIDPNYVTLTQDQLNTILNLVKTKQDIDVANIINKKSERKDSSSDSGSMEDKNSSSRQPSRSGSKASSRSSHSSDQPKENKGGENILGLLGNLDGDEKSKKESAKKSKKRLDEKSRKRLDEKSRKGSSQPRPSAKPDSNAIHDKENDEKEKDENKEDRVGKENESVDEENKKIYTFSGTLLGLGSREANRSKLEENRKQWIQELNEQIERNKTVKNQSKSAADNLAKDEIPFSNTNTRVSSQDQRSNYQQAPAVSQVKSIEAAASEQSSASRLVNEVNKNLPAAIRSSFFLGEAAPRNHAFSAKKREQQQLWKEELAKQIAEQKMKKEVVKRKNKAEDAVNEDAWNRHFDTMKLPTTVELDQSQSFSDVRFPLGANQPAAVPSSRQQDIDHATEIRASDDVTSPSPSNYDDVATSHLRKMTSLLDPAEKDAMKLRRQKQMEHRRAITEQVEEKRKMKEKDERIRKQLEDAEERKLDEDRKTLRRQFEREKMTQQEKEELREKQTRELYQQMQEAQAQALREKFEKRQQKLRSHGHDTTRLEKTHQNQLQSTTPHPQMGDAGPIGQPPIVPNLNLSFDNFEQSPRLESQHKAHPAHTSHPHPAHTGHPHPAHPGQPVQVTANTDHGPIQLQISLTQSGGGGFPADLRETSCQTDDDERIIGNLSDAETEYHPLPRPRGERAGKDVARRKRRDSKPDSTGDSHYDRFARSEKKEEKPQWGAARKKKEYVPASHKYVNGTWRQRHQASVKRREEELLQQQALNDPQRLRQAANRNKQQQQRSPPLPAHKPQRHNDDTGKTKQRSTTFSSHVTSSPPVPSHRHRDVTTRRDDVATRRDDVSTQRRDDQHPGILRTGERPTTAMSVTTEQAKYKSYKHTRDSPVPENTDFVEYRRSEETVLDPNKPMSRPPTSTHQPSADASAAVPQPSVHPTATTNNNDTVASPTAAAAAAEQSKDPLINADVVRQRDRQDRILKEISILRHGLLLKQREVASYPVAMTMSGSSVLNKNLAERTNDYGTE